VNSSTVASETGIDSSTAVIAFTELCTSLNYAKHLHSVATSLL